MTGLIITIALLGLIFYYYNRIISMREAVISSETEISVQLDRRGKVFDSLLATVKKYLSHCDVPITLVLIFIFPNMSPIYFAPNLFGAFLYFKQHSF